jgi:hypothetical protein
VDKQDGTQKHETSNPSETQSIEFTPKRARVLGIFFRIFTILEFGFLGFILYDLFRKYIITGNLDWWKK